MGSRVRTIVDWIERKKVISFDLQKALLKEHKVIMGDSTYSREIELKLLSEPEITNGVAYIFTTESIPDFDRRSSYQERHGKNPVFTGLGVCDKEPDRYNLHLIETTLEHYEYQTT